MTFLPLGNFLTEEIKKLGNELGETCVYWLNDEIMKALPTSKLREDYFNQCHEPEAVYYPHLRKMEVRCRYCNLRIPNECTRIFPKIADAMLNELSENLHYMSLSRK